ncbi:MAG: DsrE/DsrF/TusD sulfur relay family protein [Candidatus Hodarchaeales archaeon]
MNSITIILNDAPYGSERSYNGLRTAMTLQKREGVQVKVFLFADATFCALKDQKTPDGYYNIGRMIRSVAKKGKVGACGACLDARGLENLQLVDGVLRSSMNELTDWILASDKIINF